MSYLTVRTTRKIVTETPTMTVAAQSVSMNRPSAWSDSCINKSTHQRMKIRGHKGMETWETYYC